MTLENMETISDIASLHKQIQSCSKCSLCNNRTNPVPGKGNPDADIMFCGEAPGREEDQQGLPFVGKAGNILDELLESVNRSREEVFICNNLCCKPPGNRDPSKQELMACAPYLCQHITLIQPLVLCTLGRVATSNVFSMMKLEDEVGSMGKMHGQTYFSPITSKMTLIPLYHPASVLYDSGKKDILFEDIKVVKEAAIPF